MLQHKLLQISSRDRVIGLSNSTSDFTVNMNNIDGLQKVKSVVLKHATIPNVFYNISSLDGNNVFTYNIAGTPGSFTVPEGQYSVADFLVALDLAGVAIGLVSTFDTVTSKLSFTTTTNIEWLDLNDGNAMAEVLGIKYGTGSGADVGSYAAQGMVGLEGVRNVYIESVQLGEANLLRSNNTTTSTLAVVPITVPFLGIEHYTSQHADIDDVDSVSRRYGKNIQSVSIKLLDHDGHVLDLQGHHFSMVVKIYF